MHPDREIVRTNRRSDGLSTRPDDPNTLTHQSAGTNNTCRDLLLGPVTWNPVLQGPIYVYGYGLVPDNTVHKGTSKHHKTDLKISHFAVHVSP